MYNQEVPTTPVPTPAEIPGPAAGYTDLVDYCLSSSIDEWNGVPLRPSSAGKCHRSLLYELLAFQKKITIPPENKEPNVRRLLALGHSIEWHAIKNLDLITKMPAGFKIRFKQQSLPLFTLNGKTPLLVEGSLDLAIVAPDGTTCFMDVKSAKDKFHAAFKTYWDSNTDKFKNMASLVPIADSEQAFFANDLGAFLAELDDPFFVDNFIQLNLYATSDFARIHNVTHGSIYRYNKNDSRHVEIRFRPSQKVADRTEAKFQLIYTTAEQEDAAVVAKGLRCEFPIGGIKHAFCACHRYAGEDPKQALQAYFDTWPAREWPVKQGKLPAEIAEAAQEYEQGLLRQTATEAAEQRVAQHLFDKMIAKIELDTGSIYELKLYKTGGVKNGPRIALKRSKR